MRPGAARSLFRRLGRSRPSYWLYRYRYLASFAGIGLLAMLAEVAAVSAMPDSWPWPLRAGLGFALGLALSFGGNARYNFRVPATHLRATFVRFAAVSALSFAFNMAMVAGVQTWTAAGYGPARLASAGALFLAAYALHRRYTFDLARNFGIAVYASSAERVARIRRKIGRHCDHIHVDLIDETMDPDAAPVDLGKLDRARRLWPGVPVCLHVMSAWPSKWIDKVWDRVDWVLVHLNAREDALQLVLRCKLGGKRAGVVWHPTDPPGALAPYLPHVDFVMVLGIPRPGRSGQKIMEEAIAMAAQLDRLRGKYGFEVMFDGGVAPETVGRIRAKYIVAASAVLKAPDPVRAAHTLRTGARYERRAA